MHAAIDAIDNAIDDAIHMTSHHAHAEAQAGKADPAFDVTILGAGPAGLCAALRLQQLGYRVAIIERSQVWPRSQIGEALTPGIKNIIDLLDANDALQNVALRTRLPVCLRWHHSTPELRQQADAAMVDRGQFDAALLQLAAQRGVTVLRPARVVSSHGSAGQWCLTLETAQAEGGSSWRELHTRYVMQATGRAGPHPHILPCAPRLMALWADWKSDRKCGRDMASTSAGASALHRQTRVEALEQGWLWSSPLANGGLRLMLLCDPASDLADSTPHARATPAARLQAQCRASTLFAELAAPLAGMENNIHACLATPYLDYRSWQDGWIKLGDCAFALDPISSSGVEKAMRFSLQAVIALHTLDQAHSNSEKTLAREFFQQRLLETCARHSLWTEGYYGQSWCHTAPFWQARAHFAPVDALTPEARSMLADLHAERATQQTSANAPLAPPPPRPLPNWQAHQQIGWHAQVRMVELPCIVDDRVILRPALHHPNLARPIAFLENEPLLPHLAMLHQPSTLAAVLAQLNRRMALPKAQRMLGWLWQQGLLQAC
jgi:2-polyprenyl-6-methoxyphenol hydroxylase-like FAD-dependent oxidoreductase